MFAWLNRKNIEARIYLVAKDLDAALSLMPRWRIAKIKIIGTAMVRELSEINPQIESYFFNPENYSQEFAISVYELLENVRNKNNHDIKEMKRQLAGFSILFPDIAARHAEDVARGIEIFMATIGMFIDPRKSSNVLNVWKKILESMGDISGAIENFESVKGAYRGMSGADTSSMFPPEDVLRELFFYLPESVRRMMADD